MRELVNPAIMSLARQIDNDEFPAAKFVLEWAGFKATEKTTFERVKEQATDLGQKAADKAVELKDQAAQKIENMRKSEPVKQ